MAEWVHELVARDGVLKALVGDEDGQAQELAIEHLGQRGMPAGAAKAYRRSTDFSSWRPATGMEYLDFFGLPSRNAQRHVVYEATDGRTTYYVPALAWIRAFFRPTRVALEAAFRPHGLEQLLYLDHSDGAVRFNSHHVRKAASEHEELYEWMLAYPSAAKMAGSVHQAAMRGAIDIALPCGQARITLYGKTAGPRCAPAAMYVTAVSISELEPGDEPMLPPALPAPKSVVFHRPNARRANIRADGSRDEALQHWNNSIR